MVAGLTAYSYARLGSLRPKDSPEFQYTAHAFGPRVGFLAGWLMLAADHSPWPLSLNLRLPWLARRVLDVAVPLLALLMYGRRGEG